MTIVLIIAVVLLITTVLYLNLVHPFICIVSCARSPETSGIAKLLWILATLGLWSTGSVIYGLFGTHSQRLRSTTIKSFGLCLLSLATVVGIVSQNPEFREQWAEMMRKQQELQAQAGSFDDFNFEGTLEGALDGSIDDAFDEAFGPAGNRNTNVAAEEEFNFDIDQLAGQTQGETSNAGNTTDSIINQIQKLRDRISNVNLGKSGDVDDGSDASDDGQKKESEVTYPTLPGESKVRINPYAQQGT